MKITDLNKEIAKREAGKKEVSIAQIAEIVKHMKNIILEKSGLDLYKDVIRVIEWNWIKN